ncbi:putative ribonuclease H-like domain-containing protein [Tanacetum coccineum]
MRIDELHKFSDGTLNDVRTALDDRLKGIRMKYLPQTIWRQSGRDKEGAMIQTIDKHLNTMRIMQSLAKFVGQSLYSNPMIQPEPEGSTQGYPLDSVEVLSYEVSVSAERVEELKRKVKIKGKKKEALLTLRQKPEHPSDTYVSTLKMKILLEPTSNKLMVAGNPFKEILLKLNLPNHRILKDGGEGTKACDDVGKARMETVPGKDYILLPLWPADLLLSQSSKSSPDDGFKPSRDDEKKITKEPRKEGVNVVGAKISIKLPDDPNMPELEDIVCSDDDEDLGIEADMNNLDAFMPDSPILTTRIHKDHPVEQIIGDLNSAPQTRRMTKNLEEHGLFSSVQQRTNHKDFQICFFACFLSQEEPKKVIHTLKDPSWIEAMQDELLQFKLQKVWTLVDLPNGKRAIGTKWVYKNKKDERGIVIKNKARLVTQAYTQEEGIDYDEIFAPVAGIEAIRLFLAYASFKDFVVYQMDVKGAFLYGKIKEEVYVCQPPEFEDPDFPNRVYKVEKTLYGLHQAPKAWYETLSTYLLDNRFQRGKIDKTLFIRREKGDIMLVQVYVDDVIFGSTKKSLCTEFKKMMDKKFQMSSMGELTFFLGLQVKQKEDGIFINSKYTYGNSKAFAHLLLKDEDGEEVDVHLYRSMIGSLMYLTSSRPDIMFAMCACARYQVNPKVSHLHAVKRIFRYLKGQPKLGLWYPKDLPFDLVAYTNSDYAEASLDRKSTIGGCQFLGCRFISWQCKKQTVVANSITEAEYVAALSCCGQNGIGVNAGDSKLMLLGINLLLLGKVNAARHKLTTAGESINLLLLLKVNAARHNLQLLVNVNAVEVAFFAKPAESEGFEQIVDFLNATIKYALTVNPTIYTSCIEQFWATVKVKMVNREQQLQALVDGKKIVVTEASVRRDLQLDDEEGTDWLPNATIFEELTRMGYEKLSQKLTFYKAFFSPQWKFLIHTILQCLSAKTTAWNEFSSTMASAIICLATNQKFNFSKYIFESMVKNLDNAGKFLMQGKDFPGRETPLFPTMVVQAQKEMGEGSAMPTDPHHTPLITQPSSSQPQRKQKSRRPKEKDTRVPQSSVPSNLTNVADEAVNEEPSMQLKELMDFCTKLQQRVLDLENTKTSQAQGITSLNKRLKKLEKKEGSRTHKLRRLYKVGRSARVVSSDEASLGDQEDASKQGRKIHDIDADEDITLENVHDAKMFDVNDLHGDEVFVKKEVPVEEVVSAAEETVNAAIITKDEITLAQALAELKSVKPKVTTATTATTKGILLQEPSESITTTTTIPSKDKGKGIMVEEPLQMKKKDQISFDEQEAIRLQAEFDEEVRLAREKDEANIALTEEWNDIQAKIETDYELAQRLQAEEQEELTVDEKATLFQQLLEKRRKHFAAKRAEEKRNRPPTRAQQRSIMCTYLKNMAGWKPKDLKSKSFANIQELFDKAFKRVNTFVDFRTELVEGTEMEESSKKAEKVDDDHEAAKMKELMKIVPDKEEVAVDAIPLATKPPSIVDWKIVKEGKINYYQIIRADGSSKRYSAFIQMLKSFDKEDLETLWKLVKAKHRFQNLHVFMLVEKRYPLTPATITDMLNKKLQADHWNEMCYQLLKLITKQLKNQ